MTKRDPKKPIRWTQPDIEYFVILKRALTQELAFFQLEPDDPFTMKTDASDQAIGAVLEQLRDGKLVPMAFFSRKLAGSQRNWTPGKSKRMPSSVLYENGQDVLDSNLH